MLSITTGSPLPNLLLFLPNLKSKIDLPTHLVICLIIGMSLWSQVSMRTVLKNLVTGLSEKWVKQF